MRRLLCFGRRKTGVEITSSDNTGKRSGAKQIGDQGQFHRVATRSSAGGVLIKARNRLLRKHGHKLSISEQARLFNMNRSNRHSSSSSVSSVSEDSNKENVDPCFIMNPVQVSDEVPEDRSLVATRNDLSYNEIMDFVTSQVAAQVKTLRQNLTNGMQRSAQSVRLMAINKVEDQIRQGIYAEEELFPGQVQQLDVLRDYRRNVEEQGTCI